MVNGTGSKQVADYQPASHSAIDCFYVYPLVSLQTTPDTTLRIDPQETAIAELEASPFSPRLPCLRPDVPAGHAQFRQQPQAQQIAYDSVLAAWRDYLAHYNDGRGVVLIGHSEGADELDQLITGQIDNNASVRRLLVSAILTGGNPYGRRERYRPVQRDRRVPLRCPDGMRGGLQRLLPAAAIRCAVQPA